MIIIGYQGIGKSTLAREGTGFIDLESSLFYGKNGRSDDWHIYYCKIAESLSEQGYVVFVSSHKQVRDYFKKSNERAVIICPDISLKEAWIAKLRERFEREPTNKNLRAWKGAERYYEDNIKNLMNDGIPVITIERMGYYLETLIRDCIDKNKDIDFHDRQIWGGEL